MIDVLVVDDQALVRGGFHMILEREPDIRVVAEAGDGLAAVALARQHKPDVVLMDVRMPKLDGLAATKRIVAESPHTRVLVLTTYDLDEYLLDAIQAGASGFLLKDVRPEQLPPAVRAVHAGDTLVGSQTTRRLIETFIQQPSAHAVPGLRELTAREREILIHIARGYTNTEIATTIHLAETTVKTHIGRILAKLHARDRVHLVILAYQAGLVRPDQPAR